MGTNTYGMFYISEHYKDKNSLHCYHLRYKIMSKTVLDLYTKEYVQHRLAVKNSYLFTLNFKSFLYSMLILNLLLLTNTGKPQVSKNQ